MAKAQSNFLIKIIRTLSVLLVEWQAYLTVIA